MLPIRTILHPTDFSEQAQHAFAAAYAVARDHGSRVVVLYVRAPAVVGCGELGPVVPDPVWTPPDVKAALDALHLPEPGAEVKYRVAEAVLRRAPCPVLTLREPFRAGPPKVTAAAEKPLHA